MLRTMQDLIQWVDSASDRHPQLGKSECGCGWQYDGVPWQRHFDSSISELAEVLPSHTHTSDGPMSYEALVEMLTPDESDDDPLYDALQAIADGTNDLPARDFAINALHKFRWPDDPAALITGYLPDARHYDEHGNLISAPTPQ